MTAGRRALALGLLAASLVAGGAARGSELLFLGRSRGRIELRFGVGTVEADILQNATTERDWDATAYQPAFVFSMTGAGGSADFRFRGLFSETEEVDDADVDLDCYDLRSRIGYGWELRKETVFSLLGAISYRSWKSRIETEALKTDYDSEVICLGGYAHLRSKLIKNRLYLSAEFGGEVPVEGGAAYADVETSRLNGDLILESRLGLEWRLGEDSWLSLGFAWEKAELDFGGDPNTVDEITTAVFQLGVIMTF
jgi:hypothetical protein